jgi:hypothetical protein
VASERITIVWENPKDSTSKKLITRNWGHHRRRRKIKDQRGVVIGLNKNLLCLRLTLLFAPFA